MPKRIVLTMDGAKRPASEASVNKTGRVYALTCRHNPKYKDKEAGILWSDKEKNDLYYELIGKLKARGMEIEDLYFERKGGLHFHCKAIYPKKLYYKAWQYHPFSLVFKDVYDPKGWLDYSQKESERNQWQTILNNYSQYAFSDSD